MIISGAEIWRVEDSLHRMLTAYGFVHQNLWVISTCIQATVETKDGKIYTQIRDISGTSMHLGKLDQLNDLSRYACANRPGPGELRRKLEVIRNKPGVSLRMRYFASILAGAGFTVFFNGDWADAGVACLASILVVSLGERIGKLEKNPLIFNTFVAFALEIMIIGAVVGEIGHHMSTITIGVIMLLISALGLTNGIRDLLQRNTLSGISAISNSILGACGIAIGISLAMLTCRGAVIAMPTIELVSNEWIQLVSGTIGCVGFALLFGIRGRQLVFSGIGAFLTWEVYLLAFKYVDPTVFVATLIAATFVAAYASLMARINKAPATVFLTATVFPLIPGAALYYTVYGAMVENLTLFRAQGQELFLTCLGIAFGFIVFEILEKYVDVFLRKYFF